MIYLQGDIAKPETWKLSTGAPKSSEETVSFFDTRKEARSWVIEEIKRRAKVLGRIKHAWQERKEGEMSF